MVELTPKFVIRAMRDVLRERVYCITYREIEKIISW
jgi:hypothetical protein